MIAVGVITAPRERPTLERSMQSFRNAGFNQNVLVFAEPGSRALIMDGVFFAWNPATKGNFRNWVSALANLALTSHEDWLMICEDDIEWARDASTILESDLSLYADKKQWSTGAISLYCPIRMSKVLERKHGGALTRGWYAANIGRSTWGAQCLVFHRSWAMALLEDKVLESFIKDPRWHKNVDAIVAETINRAGRDVVYRIPCLVDHTFGEGNSSLGYRVDRPDLKTKYFREFA